MGRRYQLFIGVISSFILLMFFSISFSKVNLSSKIRSLNASNRETIRSGIIVVKFKASKTPVERLQYFQENAVQEMVSRYRIYEIKPFWQDERISLQSASEVGINRIFYCKFPDAIDPWQVSESFRTLANVEYAEPLYINYIVDTPNDPLYGRQDFYNIIQAPFAWGIVKGEEGNVVIAIVDGGTEITHPDIQANLWTNPGEIPNNNIDDDGNGYVDDVHGWNFANQTPDPTGLPTTPSNAFHGTHTAGIASAVANNSIGIAGASWNARLMPINAGHPNTDRSIAFGYDGVAYAAANGAQVISLSWGRSGGPSAFEQDVIQFAIDRGAAIVAAAGNENSSDFFFPAGYKNVLSVAATDDNDKKASFSNFGITVDVAAPGVGILSTASNSSYATANGTSMATPLVAGIVGLVRTLNPNWNGVQAAEQVRVTADDINSLNPGYQDLLGKGRINAFRAVSKSSPSVRIDSVYFTESDGNGIIEPGDTVDVSLKMINYLNPVSNLQLSLSTKDNYTVIQTGSFTVNSINTLEKKLLSNVFRFIVADNAPSGHPVLFKVNMTSGNYTDYDYFKLTILPTFGLADINNVVTTITGIGRIGFVDPFNSSEGLGFRFKNGPNLLFEGALMMGVSSTRISNAARGIGNNPDADFEVAPSGDLYIITPGSKSDQESMATFVDSKADNPMNLRIVQETYAMADPPYDDFIIFLYSVEYLGADTLKNFHFGMYLDWDMDGANYKTNKVGYDAARKLGYAYDTGDGPKTYVGVMPLTGGNVNYRGIYNDENDPHNPPWGTYDGYTDQEKWESLSGGIQFPDAGPGDIAQVMALGPFDLTPGNILELGFALLGGDSLADLQQNADSARTLWAKLFPTALHNGESETLPRNIRLWQNYPNPFNPETIIRYSIPPGITNRKVSLFIYNTLGERVRSFQLGNQKAGEYRVTWDGKNDRGEPVPSGIYFYTLKVGQQVQSRKMVLIR